MRFSARFFSAVIFFVFCLSLLFPIVQAHAQAQSPYFSLMKTDENVSVNISTFTQGIMFGMISSATCMVGGIDFMSKNHTCLTFNSKTEKFGYATPNEGGILGLATNGMAFLYTSPFHSTDYFRYITSNFGIAKHAIASNTGFDQLSPIAKMWIAMRNITYLLLVLAFTVVGFAIMIRAKIDPRTVMTIENQVPKLIVAIILVTFSFAIAGFLIDVMWIITYLMINLFATIDPALQAQLQGLTTNVVSDPFSFANATSSTGGGIFGIAAKASGSIYQIVFNAVNGIISNGGFFGALIGFVLGFPASLAGILVGGVKCLVPGQTCDIGTTFTAFSSAQLGGITTAIAFLIFAFALLAVLFRLFFSLLKAYALFLIFAVFGPVIILMGILPGSKVNFEDWIRHIAAYLISFPTVVAIFLLARVFYDMFGNSSNGFSPPLLGIATQNPSSLLGPLIGFAILMLAPGVVNMVQEALKAPDPKFLQNIQQGFATGASFTTGAAARGWERATHGRNLQTGADEAWLRRLALGNPENAGQGIRGRLRQLIEGARIPQGGR